MFTKKIFSLLGLLFIGNRIGSVFSANAGCNVKEPKNCISNVYYLVNKEDNSIITNGIESGSLYYCSGEETISCEEQTGVGYYAVDKQTVYVCQVYNGVFSCQKKDVTSNSCASESDIGKIYPKDESTLAICLNYDENQATAASIIELNGSSNGNYLVYKNSDPALNIFGITGSNENYAIVGIQDKIAILNSTYSNGLKYVYADTTNKKIMIKGENSYPKDGTTNEPDESKIIELLCSSGKCKNFDAEVKVNSFTGFNNQPGIYLLKIDGATTTVLTNSNIDTEITDALDKVGLYNCDKELNCERVAGYAWNTGKTKVYKIPASGSAEEISESAGTSHVDSFCTGRLGLIYTNGSKKICVEDGVGLEIAPNKYYIFGDTTMDSSSPFLSIANKLLKITADYAVIDDTFKAENSRNYIVQVGLEYYSYIYDESSTRFIKDDTYSTGVKNYNHHDTNFNIYDEYPLKDTTSVVTETITNWKLFNCKHGKCSPTFGYMKSQNENKYFKYNGNGSPTNGIISGNTGFTECSSSGNNGLMNDGKLCITYGDASSRVTGDIANGKLYVLTTASGDPFFDGSSKKVVVVATDYSLTIDTIYEGRSSILTHNKKHIPSNSIDDNNKSNLVLYDCDSKGECTQASGYAINGNKFYTLKASTASDQYPTIVEVTDCSGNAGSIVQIGQENYLCLDDTFKVKINDYGYYAFGESEFADGNPFSNGDQKKMIKITSDLINFDHKFEDSSNNPKCIIKNGDEYAIYSQSTKLFTKVDNLSGLFVYDYAPDSNVFVEVSSPQSVTDPEDIKNWALFDCNSGLCDRTYGYYKPEDNYFSIAQTGTNTIYSDDDIKNNPCTAASDIGNLLKDGKLCVVNHAVSGNEVKASMENSKYLLSTSSSNVFSTAQSGKFIIIEGTSTSFTLKNINDVSVQSIDSNQKLENSVSYESNDAKAKVVLLRCSEKVCKKISGYTQSAGNYYGIAATGGASSINLSEGTCGTGNVGNIILKDGYKTLCLGNNSSARIPTTGRFVIGSAVDSSKLSSNKIIKFTNDYIVVDEDLEGNANTNYLVQYDSVYYSYKYSTSNGKFTFDNSINGMKTYKKVETGANVFCSVSSMSDIGIVDLSLFSLFQCSSGKCTTLNGYVLVSGKAIYKCVGDNCNTAAVANTEKVDTCTASDTGKVTIKDATPKTIQLCNGSTATDILQTNIYYIGDNAKKYVGNEDKTIIGIPTPEIGYFIVKEGALSTSLTGAKIIKCSGGATCSTAETAASCGENDIGKFITSNNKLCIDNAVSTGVAIGSIGSYIIKSGASSAFVKSVTGNRVGVISMTANSIVLDKSQSFICVGSDLSVTTRASSSASCSSGTGYSCENDYCVVGNDAPSSVSGIPSCSGTCTGSAAAQDYCILEDKIHHVNANSCQETVLNSGVHVFKVDTSDVIKELNLDSDYIDSTDASRLLMYECDSSKKCNAVTGFVKIKTYNIYTERPENWGTLYTSCYKDRGTTAATLDFTEPIYYCKEDNAIYSITSTGSLAASKVASCSNAFVGKITTENKICTTADSSVPFISTADTANYLLYLSSGNLVVNASKHIFLTKSITGINNGVNIIDAKKPEVLDLTTKDDAAVTAILSNIAIFECNSTGKVCSQTYGYIKSSTPGYFKIASDGNAGNAITAGCANESEFGNLHTGAILCNKASSTVTFETGNTQKLYQLAGTTIHSNPFTGTNNIDIVVEVGKTYMVKRTMTAGVHLYKIDSTTLEITDVNYTGSDTIADGDATKLAIYNCNESACTKTSGYVKVGSNIYIISNTGNSSKGGDQTTCTGKNFGDLDVTNSKLCLGDGKEIQFNTGNDVKFYTITNADNNIFTGGTGQTAKKLIIRSVKNALILDNLKVGANDYKNTKIFIIKVDDDMKTYACDDNSVLSEESVSAVKIVEKFADDIYIIVDSISEDSLLFNCDTGVCKQTVGYYKDAGDNYYAVSSTGSEKIEGAGFVSCSSEIHVGLLTSSSKKLCLEENADSSKIITTNSDAKYLLSVPGNHDGVFANQKGKNILIDVSSSGAFIVHDNLSKDKTPILFSSDAWIKKTEGNAEIDATGVKTKLKIYECAYGECDQTVGYVKGDSVYYKVESGNEESSEFTVLTTTCAGNVGKLLNVNSGGVKLCVNDEYSEGDTIAANAQYIIYDGNDFKYVRIKASIVSISDIEGTITNGVNLINSEKAKQFDVSTDAAIKSEVGDISKLHLYYCNTGEKKICIRTYGYLKTTDSTAVFYGLGPSSSSKLDSLGNSCGSEQKGLLYKAEGQPEKFCLTGSSDDLPFAAKKTYKFNDTPAATNAFTGNNSAIDKLIELSTNTIVINPIYYRSLNEGVHAFSIGTTSKEITEINLSANEPTLIDDDYLNFHLYGCNKEKCIPTYGYIYNGKAVGNNIAYAIKGGSGVTNEKKASGEGAVNCDTIGTLYSTNLSLCITTTVGEAEPFSTSGTGYYIINVPGSNVFTKDAKDSIIIKKVKNAFVLNNFEVVGGKNYIVNNILYSYDSGTTIMTKSSTPTILVTKKVNDSNDFLVEADLSGVTSKDDLTGIDIYSCDATGACSKKNGYVLAGTGAGEKIYENFSTGDTWKDVTQSTTCTTAADHAGGVQIASSKIQLCMPTTGTAASFGDVNSSNTYLFGKTATTFKLYKGNGSTSTIVVVEDPVVGYYMTKAAGTIETETTAMTTDLLVTCVNNSGISCTTTVTNAVSSANAGYYLNNAKSNSIIQCTATTNCQLLEDSSLQDKSFVLHSGVLISCNNSKVCSNPTTANNDKYVVKVGDNYNIYSSDGTKLALVSGDGSGSIETYEQDATYITLFKLADLTYSTTYSNKGSIAKISLFDCGDDGSCYETYGYYKAGTRYVSINTVHSNNDFIEGVTQCDAIGALLKLDANAGRSKDKLCTAASGTDGYDMDDKEYIITYSGTTCIFNGENVTGEILVKATDKSFTLNNDNANNSAYCNNSGVATAGPCSQGGTADCCNANGTCTAAACV